MVSSDLWTDIDSRMGEKFMIIPEKAFASFSVVPELLQLTSVRRKLIFSQFSDKGSMKHLLSIKLVVMAFIYICRII